jgi:hypothetical protein
MKDRNRYLPVVLLMLITMAICMGCARNADPEESVTVIFDGQWNDENGNKILFLPDEAAYVLETPGGRIGKGAYAAENGQIGFNRFIYDLNVQDDGSISLRRNGSPANEEENLNGAVFRQAEQPDIELYEIESLAGSWRNDQGAHLTLDIDAMEYKWNSELGAGAGTLFDEFDGRGLLMALDDEGSAIVLRRDGTMIIETEEPGFKGTVFSRE